MHQARRARFMAALQDGVAIIPTHPVANRTADQDHPFRPDSDFFYLTGFEEPEAVLVLAPNHPEHQVIMFVRPHDAERETWNGRRAGIEGAVADYGADVAYRIDQIDAILPRYLENVPTLFYRLGAYPEYDVHVMAWLAQIRAKVRQGINAPGDLKDPATILHEMRLVKSAAEIDLLRRAGRIAAEGHVAAMKACRPGMGEYQLQAEVEYVFRKRGAQGPSYPSIVGGGVNACILHYVENDAVLRDGDLVLIDAGCELSHYASDITRTFPVNGRFSPAQRALYELVLEAQTQAIDMVRPGVTFWSLHEHTLTVLTTGLVRLGLLAGSVPELIAAEAYKRFFMHKTSHWLGLDVHDVGSYKIDDQWRSLVPGMVLTVEPGLYVPAECPGVDPRWWGIGIRIEDDVLVTPEGHEVLTPGVPRAIAEIEELMTASQAATRP